MIRLLSALPRWVYFVLGMFVATLAAIHWWNVQEARWGRQNRDLADELAFTRLRLAVSEGRLDVNMDAQERATWMMILSDTQRETRIRSGEYGLAMGGEK